MSFLDTICSAVKYNKDGWGPTNAYSSFHLTHVHPLHLFVTKGDQLGQIADWSVGITQDRRNISSHGVRNRPLEQIASGKFQLEEDANFHYVHQNRNKRIPGFHRSLKHKLQQTKMIQMQKQQREEKMQGNVSQNVKQRKLREREKQKAEKKWLKNFGSRYQQHRPSNLRKIAPSIEVRPSWEMVLRSEFTRFINTSALKSAVGLILIQEIEFSSLNKLNVCVDERPKDIRESGYLDQYDTSFDRITPKTAIKLIPTMKCFNRPTISNDPLLQEIIAESNAQVFATDIIIATLMTCTRSVYPWDILVTRKGSSLFFDKRDKSNFDLLTVNENSSDPPQEYFNLSSEATLIDRCFSQQVLKRDKLLKSKLQNQEDSTKQPQIPTLNRYRRWQLKDVSILVKCEVNALAGDKTYCNVRALNEYDPKITDDWRKKLESQMGAVIATELKNNSNKLSKWAIVSVLGGCELLKIGYVSRENFHNLKNHVILGTQDFNPTVLASQVSLDLNNCWGILYVLIQECLKLNEGKYFIVRNSSKHALRLYQCSGESDDASDYEKGEISSNSDSTLDD